MRGRGRSYNIVLIAAIVSGAFPSMAWADDSKTAVDSKVVMGVVKPANPAHDGEKGSAKVEKEVIVERAIVPTKTLYSFPEGESLNPPAAKKEKPEKEKAEPTYTIGSGDVLSVQIFDDPALSRQVTVRFDGYISLPQAPDIKVAGLTRAQAEQRVHDAYVKVFRTPHLNLTINDAKSRNYYVMGDVQRPAEYPFTQPISLLEAIETAGGIRVDMQGGNSNVGAQGELAKAVIIRHEHGERAVHEFDLRGLRNPGQHPSDTPVYPGDIVYVPEGMNLVYVLGEVRAPSVYPLLEHMTLLDLLARAGGPTEATARMRSIVLLRRTDATNTEAMLIDLRKALKTGFSPELAPGDIVYIPRGTLVRLHDNLMRFTRLTETISPLMSLYQQAYDSYYTPQQFHHLLHNTQGTDVLSVLQTATNLGLLFK